MRLEVKAISVNTSANEWIEKLVIKGRTVRETQVALRIQPKPRWMPAAWWNRLCRRVVLIEEQRIR